MPKLIALLEDKNARAGAAYAIGRVTNYFEPALPHLRRLTQSENPQVRACAALTLWKFTGDSSVALPVLAEALNTSKPEREFIATCLGEIGPAAKESLPLLTAVTFSNENYSMAWVHRLFAAEAILRIDPTVSNAMDVILKTLGHSDRWERLFAARTLERLGTSAYEAKAALEKAAHDKDRDVRLQAQRTLSKIQFENENVATRR